MQVSIAYHPYLLFTVYLYSFKKIICSSYMFKLFGFNIKVIQPASISAYPKIIFCIFDNVKYIVIAYCSGFCRVVCFENLVWVKNYLSTQPIPFYLLRARAD